MPKTASAIKAVRQSAVRADRRRPFLSKMKTMIRKVKDALSDGKSEDAKMALPEAFKAIDMATKKNLLHKNTASRRKSLLSRMVK